MIKKILFAGIIVVLLGIAITSYAQQFGGGFGGGGLNSLWKYTGTVQPVNESWVVEAPGGFSGVLTGGSAQSLSDIRYVLRQGTGAQTPSMTGSLTVQATISGAELNIMGPKNSYFLNGNVGIGTTGPTEKLEVNGNIVGTIGYFSNQAQANILTSYGNTDLVLRGRTNYGIDLQYNGGTSGIYIKNDGNVGIGTTSPSAKLSVAGTMSGTHLLISGTGSVTSPIIQTIGGSTPNIIMNGNVGIGTTGPSAKLEVTGAGILAYLSGTANDSQNVLRFRTGGTDRWSIGVNNWVASNGAKFEIGDGTAARLVIDTSAGNVGIGTTGPTSSITGTSRFLDINGGASTAGLTVHGSSDTQEFSIHKTAGVYIDILGHATASNNFIQFRTSNTNSDYATFVNAMRIQSDGNVGIGTTEPNQKLEVIGMLRLGTGTYYHDIYRDGTTGALAFTSNQSNGYYFNAGNVGIGTTGPDKKLSVAGTMSGTHLLISGTGSSTSPIIQTIGGSTPNIIMNGNVGIGTTGPASVLHIAKSGMSLGDSILRVGNPSQTVSTWDWAIDANGVNAILGLKRTQDANYGMVWEATTGNVGIGTTAPGALLHVYSSTQGALRIETTGADTYNSKIEMLSPNGDWHIGTNRSDLAGNANNIYISNNDQAVSGTRMVIDTNGNVGIGTTAPDKKLSVAGTMSGTHLLISGTGSSTSPIIQTIGGSTPNIIMNGNVGIGTTAPGAFLDVAGSQVNGKSLILRSGDVSTGTDSNQIIFGYDNTQTYQHAIKTRHNSSEAAGNDIDFYLWKYGTDAAGTIGTQHVMTLEGSGNVGIGTTGPGNLLTVNQAANTTDGTNASYGIMLRNQTVDNLSFGSDASYAYLQSWASKPLKINSQGNNTLLNPTSGNVGIGATEPAQKLTINGNVFILTGATLGIGNSNPETTVEIAGTLSGTIIHAEGSLTSSGNVVFATTLSGGTTVTFSSLRGCDTIDTDAQGILSCGTDADTGGVGTFGTGNVITIGDGRYALTSGDTMTGALTVNLTISGARIYAGSSFSGAGLTSTSDCNADANNKIQWDTTTGLFSCDTTDVILESELTNEATLETQLGAINVIVSTEIDTFSELNTLVADKTLVNEEDIVIFDSFVTSKGTVSGSRLFVGSSFSGAGLSSASDCDNGTTSKLLWDTTTGLFSCGTDQDSGGGAGTFGTGNVLTIGDGRYAMTSGDTFTGAVLIENTGESRTSVTFEVTATASGHHVHAEDTLTSSGILVVKGTASIQGVLTAAGGLTCTDCIALTDETSGNYAAGDGEAGNALTGDSGDSFFAAGTVDMNVGGTNASLTASNGALVYSTATAMALSAVSASGQTLVGQGAGAPIWKDDVRSLVWYLDKNVTTGSSASIIMPFGGTIIDVTMYANQAPVTTDFEIGINEDGLTLFSTKPEIDAGANVDDNLHAFSDTDIDPGDRVQMYVTQIGSGGAGTGITVQLNISRHP